MIKNYFKIFWKVLMRKKLYTLITLSGICFPLIILTLVVSFLSHITVHNSPQSNFDRVACINYFEMHFKNNRGDDYIFGTSVPYKLYKENLSKLKTPLIMSFTFWGNVDAKANTKTKNLRVRNIDANFWSIADFKLIEGRFFNHQDVDKSQLLAVIDTRTKEFFFGNSQAFGRQIELNNKKYTIVGVVKSTDITKTKTFGNIFIPLTTNEYLGGSDYMSGNGWVLAMFKNSSEKAKLKIELMRLIAKFDKKQITDCIEIKIEAEDESFVALVSEHFRNLFNIDLRRTYIVPVAIALILFFFLLLPALNLIYINQSRFSERIEEIGLRKSFGSPAGAIFKQFITENILITSLGGIIALLISYCIIQILNHLQVIQDCYIQLNWQVFALSTIVWVVLSFLSGALPSLKISKSRIVESLQSSLTLKNMAGFKKIKKESIWLSLEIMCVFVALFAISNFILFFGINLLTPVGFNYKGVNEIDIQNNKLSWMEQDWDKHGFIDTAIMQSSYVFDYTILKGCNPYGGKSHFGDDIQYAKKRIKADDALYVEVDNKNWNFFGLKLTAGRWMNETDTMSKICPVVINEKLSLELFETKNSLGKQFEIKTRDSDGSMQKFEIKGVVASFKHAGEFTSEGYYVFYMANSKLNLGRSGSSSRSISGYLKLKGNPTQSSEKLVQYLRTKFPDNSFQVNPLAKYRKEHLMKTLIPFSLIIFMCLSIFLIVLFGMLGVMWYNINRRIPEIGLRKSVGASNRRIFKIIIWNVLKITGLGIIPGFILVLQLPLLKLVDFPIHIYVLSIVLSILIIVGMVILFTVLPGLKAAKIQPAEALHDD